ncbi:MAG TPA: serine hydrolase domain-containing protein [Thermoanaerobaculaceae bacterium]|nr:serine hydrolase domain-containing protein [Thermoanaerobaculaceae bacterium]HPS77591.1 serine hydrolase domain-containing protein [Thermoanaerobaculaceae bacterium]
MRTRPLHVPALVFLTAALGAAVVGAQPVPSAPTAAEMVAIEKCLTGMPARVQVAIALVKGDEARFLGAERTEAGVRLVDNRSAVFQIGSVTKVFTATLLAQQVVKGALRLEDTVASRLPFTLKESGRGGVEMTLGQLASHTSGLAHHQPPGLTMHAWLHFHPDEPWRDYDRSRFEEYLKEDLELASTPGTAYFYSNLGMSLVGLVLSLKSGKPYEAMLQEGIFRPLRMSSSTTDLALVRDRVVPGLRVNGKPFPNQGMAALAPCGGLYTSAEDLASFARAEIDRTDPAIALSQKPVFTISEGEYVALGWHVYDWVGGWRTINHNGGIGGYTSTVNIDPTNRCAVIVLSNVMNEGDHGEAVRILGRALLKQVEPPARTK